RLEASGIGFSFLDAADAQQGNFPLSERRNDQLTKTRFGYKLVDSEGACFSSHLQAWQIAAESSASLLILGENSDLTGQF
ncbi:glycosyltransferase family 25 protein, partial [Vibrio sp. Vb2880]|uniref:glycosyltransferase family 25 protein n=1 Tax=Vibrio sp. Vb2880 TaxID=2816076 RepID=UPI001A8E10B0